MRTDERDRRNEELSRHKEGMEQRRSSKRRLDVRCDRRVHEQVPNVFKQAFEKDEAPLQCLERAKIGP
jgi:hypothetical protein